MPSLLTRARPGLPATGAGAGRRSRQVSRKAFSVLVAGLGLAVALSIVLTTTLGPVSVPLSESWRTVWHHVLPGSGAPPRDPLFDQIVWQFRLPRALLGAVIGAGLGIVGCALQAAVRNPLAKPYLLGISSGASFGAVLVLVLGSEAAAGLSLSAAAFVGALVATTVVYVLAKRRGRITPFRLILAGVALAYLFQAMYSYLLIKANPYATQGVLFWLLGSLGSASWSDLGLPAAAVLVGSVYLLLQARSLNSVLAGEETAVSLGLNLHRFRVRILVVTSLLIGVMVAVSGAIAFVGLIIPHLCRLIVGSDHRRLLPVAAFTGAAFLVLVDLAARTIDQPTELPLSVVTAVFGVPFFIWLLRSPRAQPGGGVRMRILSDVAFQIAPGELVGLLGPDASTASRPDSPTPAGGPNGSGKSTLPRTIYRALRPVLGTVCVGDDDAWTLSARASAQRTAVVVRDSAADFDFEVFDAVSMGRNPHKGMLERDNADDDRRDARPRARGRPLRPRVCARGRQARRGRRAPRRARRRTRRARARDAPVRLDGPQ